MNRNMKKKLYILLPFIGVCSLFSGCDDFLDETPNKSGSAYIYHMDQLYGMNGSIDLYMMQNTVPSSIQYGIVGNYMTEVETLTDAVEFDPYYWAYGLRGGDARTYSLYKWESEQLLDQYAMNTTWTPCWERISRFNTVLENMDRVQQTTEAIRHQVEGEALFGRAYYHFMLLTIYSLWDKDAPGIGYRDNTNPGEVPARQTVGYTLDRIYEDLDNAEAALTKAGRSHFDFERNFRPTVPTVQAFRARVDLYSGNYASALENANKALAAHNTLVSFKDDPNYTLYPNLDYYLLDKDGNVTDEFIPTKYMAKLYSQRTKLIPEYQELYLPNITKGNIALPISEWYYNLWDRENDARWIHFYAEGNPLWYAQGAIAVVNRNYCITYEAQQWLKPSSCYSYSHFGCNGGAAIFLGMTTAEMYLIKAECMARTNASESEVAEVLKTLRRTRFVNEEAANNIGGSLQEVLDERSREMGAFWRYFDIKRLNGAENAGITIRRKVMSDPLDPSTATDLVIEPTDPRWAMPFCTQEAKRMGWEQNPGWE